MRATVIDITEAHPDGTRSVVLREPISGSCQTIARLLPGRVRSWLSEDGQWLSDVSMDGWTVATDHPDAREYDGARCNTLNAVRDCFVGIAW